MMFTKFMIVADETNHNYRVGQVIAELCDDGKGWQDPFGGVFSDKEKSEFYEVANGRSLVARLDGVTRDRRIRCRLTADF